MIADVPRTGTLSSAGVKIIENGKFVFNSPDAVKVVERYKDAYAAGAMPPEALNADYLGNSALYKQGKTAWTTASAGFPSELEKEARHCWRAQFPRRASAMLRCLFREFPCPLSQRLQIWQ